MIKHCLKIIGLLDEEINNISLEIIDPISLSESAIKTTLNTLSDLKSFILKKGFKDQDEEIQFFKELKPKIVSKLIYYNAIYKFETKKPHGGEETIKKSLLSD